MFMQEPESIRRSL